MSSWCLLYVKSLRAGVCIMLQCQTHWLFWLIWSVLHDGRPLTILWKANGNELEQCNSRIFLVCVSCVPSAWLGFLCEVSSFSPHLLLLPVYFWQGCERLHPSWSTRLLGYYASSVACSLAHSPALHRCILPPTPPHPSNVPFILRRFWKRLSLFKRHLGLMAGVLV